MPQHSLQDRQAADQPDRQQRRQRPTVRPTTTLATVQAAAQAATQRARSSTGSRHRRAAGQQQAAATHAAIYVYIVAKTIRTRLIVGDQ